MREICGGLAVWAQDLNTGWSGGYVSPQMIRFSLCNEPSHSCSQESLYWGKISRDTMSAKGRFYFRISQTTRLTSVDSY